MKNRIFINLIVILVLVGATACERFPKGTPSCIKKEIRKNKDCVKKVVEYEYQGKTVYLFEPFATPACSYIVYDENCNYLCSPSGGISGKGDGKCPDFNETAIKKETIWTHDD